MESSKRSKRSQGSLPSVYPKGAKGFGFDNVWHRFCDFVLKVDREEWCLHAACFHQQDALGFRRVAGGPSVTCDEMGSTWA